MKRSPSYSIWSSFLMHPKTLCHIVPTNQVAYDSLLHLNNELCLQPQPWSFRAAFISRR